MSTPVAFSLSSNHPICLVINALYKRHLNFNVIFSPMTPKVNFYEKPVKNAINEKIIMNITYLSAFDLISSIAPTCPINMNNKFDENIPNIGNIAPYNNDANNPIYTLYLGSLIDIILLNLSIELLLFTLLSSISSSYLSFLSHRSCILFSIYSIAIFPNKLYLNILDDRI